MSNHSELWLPPFQPKQQLFFDSRATEILWAGDTRAGKTAGTKLFLIHMCSMIPGLQTDIWRLREEDVISNYMEGDFGFPALLSQWIKDKIVTCNRSEVRFSNGSLIELSNCWTDAAMTKAQGIPKHIRVVDEAGQIPERRLKWLKLWMTMSKAQKEKIPEEWRDRLPKLIYLTNRIGQSKGFLKRVFVRSRPKYAIEQVGAFKQQYIPADVRDNPMEDPEATIARITEGADAATAKALLSEDGWDAQTGNYFETWESERHVIKAFIIPDYWLRFRTFDYGSYEPWACLWWAISPGVTIHEGTKDEKYLPRGCKVIYREWYGCKAEHPQEAIGTDAYNKEMVCTNLAPKGWSNKDMANGVIDRTEKRFDSQPTFTDKFPFIKLGGRAIEHDFKDAGLKLSLGELDRKNRGSQTISHLNGVKLNADSEEHYPMLVVFENCKYVQDYMPMIERHPTEGKEWDYQENGEATHIVDCVTLGVMAHNVVYDAPEDSEVTITKALADPRNTKSTVRNLAPDLNL